MTQLMLLLLVLFLLCIMLLLLVVYVLFYPALVSAWSARAGNRRRTTYVVTTMMKDQSDFPSTTFDKPLLSIVIPAYNEQDRLVTMLQPAVKYLRPSECPALLQLEQHRQQCNAPNGDKKDEDNSNTASTIGGVEWIVVNDGSTDETERVYWDYFKLELGSVKTNATIMTWRYLPLPQNQGKGAAVKAGMLASTGSYCLMVDADGATQFDDLSKLTAELLAAETETSVTSTTPAPRNTCTMVWGSRAHLQDSKRRSLLRQVLMKGFHAFVRLLCTRSGSAYIRDTQCGFKLFPRSAAQTLFSNLHLNGWAFDTELLILSSMVRIPIVEVPVNWHEVEGSKLSTSVLNIVRVAVSMLRDMVCVRICYETGLWKIHTNNNNTITAVDTDEERKKSE